MANKFTDAVFHAKVPAVDKAVLWAIAHRTDNSTGACYPSIKTISKEAGCSPTIVKAVVAYAVSVGLLGLKNRKDGRLTIANEYTFNLTKLRSLTRADSRFLPDGQSDQGTRSSTASGMLPAQVGTRLGARSGGGPEVGSLPARGWGWRRLQNSEVDLRSRSRHSNSDSTAETETHRQDTDQNQEPNPRGFAPNPTGTSRPGTPGIDDSCMDAALPRPPAEQPCEGSSLHEWREHTHTTDRCSECGTFRTSPAVTEWTEADDLEGEYMEFVECYDPFDTYWSAPEKRTSLTGDRLSLSASEFARAIGAVAQWN